MTPNDEWSPDEPLQTETFEQGDEAFDEASRVRPTELEEVEQDPSLNPTLQVDDRELEEAGAEFDDPERMVTLEGGIDDPDGLGDPVVGIGPQTGTADGWQLDAPLTRGDEKDEDPDE
jgi:hypothetical protein